MLKRILQLLTLAALVNLIYQYWPRGDADKLIPVRNAEGNWGFVDESGRVRVEFEWDIVDVFYSGDLAGVQKDQSFGAINRRGEVIIPLQYDRMISFTDPSKGLAEVRRDGAYGWVDREGNEVVKAEWAQVLEFEENGLCKVRMSGKKKEHGASEGVDDPAVWGLIDMEGRQVVAPEWEEINNFGPYNVTAAMRDDQWFLIDREGKTLVDLKSDYEYVGGFGENGLARVVQGEMDEDFGVIRDAKYGWIDQTGRLVIPLDWSEGENFDHQGLALVARDGKWGWINGEGEVVLPLKWQEASSFDKWGRASVMKNDMWGMIDREGNFLIEPAWSSVRSMEGSDYIEVSDFRRNKGIIDQNGEIIVEPKWNYIEGYDEKGYVPVLGQGAEWHLLDSEGNLIFMLESLSAFYYDSNDLAAITDPYVDPGYRGLTTAWINRRGDTVIDVPEGWWGPRKSTWGGSKGLYVILGREELKGVAKWMAKLRAWIGGEDVNKELDVAQCRVYNKHGNLIWNSVWLRKTTKAWLYFIAAMLTLCWQLCGWAGERRKDS